MTQRVLVIAAHPDDELLGCGGTLALHAQAGDDVVAVIAAEGESLRYGPAGVGQVGHTDKAAEILGITSVIRLGFEDQQLDRHPLTEIIAALHPVVTDLRPQAVYCQWGGDVNLDHQLLFKAALVATRPTEATITQVLAFDTASSTEWAFPRAFVPDTWVDVSTVLDRKLAAMACYESELRDYPHPRSLEALEHRARAWGNQACLDAAEVFMTIRRISRDGKTPH